MTALVIAVTTLACLAALLTLAAGLLRHRYTSPARWRQLVPPGALTQMHAEQAVRDATPVVVVKDLRAPHAVLALDAAAGDWYCRSCEQAFAVEDWRGNRCPNE